ncbi:MAG: hypothetical protein J7L53_08535 [Deltaproteobacteria bacterium]|nr:hypothetical protein [Deltaproteobacteria bacterium]
MRKIAGGQGIRRDVFDVFARRLGKRICIMWWSRLKKFWVLGDELWVR